MVTDLTVALKLDPKGWLDGLKETEKYTEEFMNKMQGYKDTPISLQDILIPPRVQEIDFSGVEESVTGLESLVERITTRRTLTHYRANAEHVSIDFAGANTRNLYVSEMVERKITPEINQEIANTPITVDMLDLQLSETQILDVGTKIQTMLNKTLDVQIPEQFNIEFEKSIDKLQDALASQGTGTATIKELSDNIAALKDSTMKLANLLRD